MPNYINATQCYLFTMLEKPSRQDWKSLTSQQNIYTKEWDKRELAGGTKVKDWNAADVRYQQNDLTNMAGLSLDNVASVITNYVVASLNRM
jgi:hypothetical protein